MTEPGSAILKMSLVNSSSPRISSERVGDDLAELLALLADAVEQVAVGGVRVASADADAGADAGADADAVVGAGSGGGWAGPLALGVGCGRGPRAPARATGGERSAGAHGGGWGERLSGLASGGVQGDGGAGGRRVGNVAGAREAGAWEAGAERAPSVMRASGRVDFGAEATCLVAWIAKVRLGGGWALR